MLKWAFFDEWKWMPTLLIWGDREGMAVLASTIQGVLSSIGSHELAVSTDGQSVPALKLNLISARAGISRVERASDDSFRWICSPDVLIRVAGLVEVLARSDGGSGHQYIDAEADGFETIQVQISKDEYPPDFC